MINLSTGTYQIKATAVGYEINKYNNVIISSNSATNLDITLNGLESDKIIFNTNLIDLYKNQQLEICCQLKNNTKIFVEIFNNKSEKVINIADFTKPVGTYTYYWAGRDSNNCLVGSGVYFVYYKVGNTESIKKVVVLR